MVGCSLDRVFEEIPDEWSFYACVCERGTFLFRLVFFEVVLVGRGRFSEGVWERGFCVLLN